MSRFCALYVESLERFIAGPNDEPGNPGGDDLHASAPMVWVALDAGSDRRDHYGSGIGKHFWMKSTRPARSLAAAIPWSRSITGAAYHHDGVPIFVPATGRRERRSRDYPLVTYVADGIVSAMSTGEGRCR